MRALHTDYRDTAEIDEIAMAGAVMRGERFLFISDKARQYLARRGATPIPSPRRRG